MEVGLGPGHSVLDWDPAFPPPKKGGHSPQFWPMSVVAKRLGGSGYHLVYRYASTGQATLDGDPAPPRKAAQ